MDPLAGAPAITGLSNARERAGAAVPRLQVNAAQLGLRPGDMVLRAAERTSLTVRRVLKTCPLSIRL